jgi:hypothetical protein
MQRFGVNRPHHARGHGAILGRRIHSCHMRERETPPQNCSTGSWSNSGEEDTFMSYERERDSSSELLHGVMEQFWLCIFTNVTI